MVADNGRAADGKAEERGHEYEIHIHHDRIRGNSLLADQAHELDIVQDRNNRRGNVAHQLGRAVCAGVQQLFPVKPGAGQPYPVASGVQEIQERQHAAHAVTDHRRNRCARNAQPAHRNQHIVEQHVGQAGRDREDEAHVRLFCDDEKALERGLQHEGHTAREQDAAIDDTVVDQRVARARKTRDGFHIDHAEQAQHRAEQHDRQDNHGEIAVGLLLVAFAHGARDNGAAACTQHEAERADDHRHREHDVDRAERKVADQVGYEQAVHHAVNRGNHHHDDGRQREPEQLAVGKMVG